MNLILKSKLFWSFMVLLGAALMIIGFFTKDIKMWFIAFAIALLVRYYAADFLFHSYENRIERLKQKHSQLKDG
ncbi:hypothetical protein SAMN05216235_0078 [Salinicoccus halodurans]|uniref:Uncharacterized protein n=1 Tax=Salinicoccus halodurans TaxID=407035 RepID=A0A0F7HK73_9STAP|nr:hypothetical protein AAT16_04205 [Salinicoccus halodurans]SFK51335.1 hypothetical protein SAMN05216235_0078 [Salinicoccus halodurans]